MITLLGVHHPLLVGWIVEQVEQALSRHLVCVEHLERSRTVTIRLELAQAQRHPTSVGIAGDESSSSVTLRTPVGMVARGGCRWHRAHDLDHEPAKLSQAP